MTETQRSSGAPPPERGAQDAPGVSRARLVAGATVFVVGWCSPLLVPWVATLDTLSPTVRTSISGLLVVGIPEIFSLVAVGILGKDGFASLKRKIRRSLEPLTPAEEVGPTRHRVGVAMFIVPLVFGWATPYLTAWVSLIEARRIEIAIAGDLIFIASLFVLGGAFWEKLRRLLLREKADA